MLRCQKDKFLLQSKYTYLNCAYMSPLSKKVEKAGIRGIQRKRKPYQVSPDDFFHDAHTIRMLFSKLINNTEFNRIAILPSVSYGIGNVTKNLANEKGKILLVDEQFPSNVYPWKAIENPDLEIKFITKPAGKEKGKNWNEQILSDIDEDTVAIAIGNVHWADGTWFDLEAISTKAKAYGSYLIIDGTQSVGALPFDVQVIQPDVLICAAYKWLFGPYGIALGYYGKRFDSGLPIEENWINRKGSENFGGLVAYEPEYQPQALRYEVGEHSNFVLLPMVIAALKQVLAWTPESIQEYCNHLTATLIAETAEFGYEYEEEGWRCGHLLGVTPTDSNTMTKVQSLLKQRKISLSVRGKSLRISPNVYNDERQIEKLIKTLKDAS